MSFTFTTPYGGITTPLIVVGNQPTDIFTAPGNSFTDSGAANVVETISISYSFGYGLYPPNQNLTLAQLGTFTDPVTGTASVLISNANGYQQSASFTETGQGNPSFVSQILDRLTYTNQTPGFYSVNLSVSGSTVTSSNGIVYEVLLPPEISGTAANQPVASGGVINPFSTVTILDKNNISQYVRQIEGTYSAISIDAATIIITDGGTHTDADGLLTGTGLSKTGVGTYALAGVSAATLQTELQGLKFAATAPIGQTVNPQFEIDLSDSISNQQEGIATPLTTQPDAATLTAKDTTTNVVIVGQSATPVAPTISGTIASQQTSNQPIDPFAYASISDGNLNHVDTISITMHNALGMVSDADGVLSGSGLTKTGAGTYTLAAGSPATINAELNALVFTPATLASGAAADATTFTVVATDTTVNLSSTPDSKTTVVNSPMPLLKGTNSDYIICNDNGSFYVDNIATGQIETPSSKTVTLPAGGVAVFDPTGNAEDVSRLYSAAFGRPSDLGGLEYWTNVLDNGSAGLTDVASAFASSPEFITDYGSLADAAFVNQLYLNVLGRPADAAGSQFWDNELASGISRGAVLIGFAESQEYKATTLSTAGDANDSEAYRLYQAALHRTPDTIGLNYWSSALATGASPSQVAQDFIGSTEFQTDYGKLNANDFVTTLYQNVLHRAPDAAGLQFWTNDLANGASQASVLLGFSDSLENRLNTASATHANWVYIPS